MPLSIDAQLERRALVCPISRQPLRREGDLLKSDARSYRVVAGVPVLVTTDIKADPAAMEAEYTAPRRRMEWLRGWLRRSDYRTQHSIDALNDVLAIDADALCLSIGGGPLRIHEKLVNLNIGLFPNVDVVGDAHQLPYADNSVDAIHSEAVFEHLHTPAIAAGEIARVLKPGARAFVCTPFLQAFHGYPSHYQNYTMTGHRKLFEDAGLEIIDSGVCNGPIMALLQLWRTFGDLFLPSLLRPLARAAYIFGRVTIAPLDRVLGAKPNAYVLASTTFLVARKPKP